MAHSDIAFSTDDTHRFLPWLIALMVAMAALLLCFGVSINGWVIGKHEAYSNSFTVEVPAQTEEAPPHADKVRDALRKLPGVTAVVQLTQDQLKEMLKPWFDSDMMKDLPVPSVFDVTISSKAAALDYAKLQKDLDDIVPGTQVDSRERWVASFAQFSEALRGMVSGMALVIAIVMTVMIAFASRASLHLHGTTVALLHSMGAEDNYIMRQFQSEAFMLTLRGSVVGCIASAIIYFAAGQYVASLGAASLPSLSMGPLHAALLCILPMACGVVAWLTALFTVRAQLGKVL